MTQRLRMWTLLQTKCQTLIYSLELKCFVYKYNANNAANAQTH